MKTLKLLIILLWFFTIINSFSFWVWSIWNDNVWDFFDFFQQIVEYSYMILWPLIVLAWKFLWNTFVYWSVFGIDKVLWQLWQIVRVFTNYMLWFIFIVSIFIYFFKADSNLSWKKTLYRIVIGAIFVNISWFLISVLIDISTILTLVAWSIWNVFSIPNTNTQENIIMVPININTDMKDNFISIWTGWKQYNACIKSLSWEIVNAPCFAFKNSNFVILNKNWDKNEDLTKSLWWITSEKISKDNTWMLISLFRYMNWAFLIDNTNNSEWLIFIQIMKLLLLLVLIIPFIILVIILVVRVIMLWVIIPLSPFILWTYILWIFDSHIKKRFKDIITIIFQPAYIVFMLSIWFVFIQAIHSMIPEQQEETEKLKKIWIYDWWISNWQNTTIHTINIWSDNWLVKIQSEYNKWNWINYSSSDYKNILYYIPWIIANLLSAFVLWSLVFIAFKSNSITEKIAQPIETYAKTWLITAPILPWSHSIESVGKTLQDIQWIPSNIKSKQSSKLISEFKKNDNNWNNNK